MLINFSFENFRSFKNSTELSLVSSSKIRKFKDHEVKSKRLSIIKNVGVFGKNASGKTNLISALTFAKSYICNSQILSNMSFKGAGDLPTSFNFVFTLGEDIYQYSFSIKRVGLLSIATVEKECLEKLQTNNSIEIYSKRSKINKSYDKEELFKTFLDGYKNSNSQLFLTYINAPERQIKGNKTSELFTEVFKFFRDRILILDSLSSFSYIGLTSSNSSVVSKYLTQFDTGMKCIEFRDISSEEVQKVIPREILVEIYNDMSSKPNLKESCVSNGVDIYSFVKSDNTIYCKKFQSYHKGIEEPFTLEEESEGTKRLINIITLLFSNQKDDTVYIIDEIEKSGHCMSVTNIIKEFQKLNLNKKNQLIFTSHHVDLMDEVLRQDEIYFTDKNYEGVSTVYPLSDFKSRNEPNVKKRYLEGRYGAIPVIGE